MLERKVDHVLVDVRQNVECEICKLPAGNMISILVYKHLSVSLQAASIVWGSI